MPATWGLAADRYELALCPLCEPAPDGAAWADDSSHRGLSVLYEMYVPVSLADGDAEQHGAECATYSYWKVECIQGHVLLTSRDFGDGDEENPPVPFTPGLLMSSAAREVAVRRLEEERA